MKVDFVKAMASRTDAELIEILTIKKDNFLPEALSCAKAELERRNLSVDETKSAKREIQEKENRITEKANTPLSSGGKLFSFFFPGLLILLVAMAFKAEGSKQKSKDAWNYTFAGIAFYIVGSIFLLSF